MSHAPARLRDHFHIHTERLLLRPVSFDDVDDCYEYANDAEWVRYLLSVPWPYERKHAVEFIATMTIAEHDKHCQLALEHDGRMVGTTNLMFRGNDVAELGYSIARRLWGRGLVPEAARAHLAHGFDACGLEVVDARVNTRNERSKRVLQKLGFRHEGTLRGREVCRGERVDHEHWSLLRDEWKATPSSDHRGS